MIKENIITVHMTEKQYDCFNLMLSCIKQEGLQDKFFETIESRNLTNDFETLLEDTSDKIHKLGWCKASTCARKNG